MTTKEAARIALAAWRLRQQQRHLIFLWHPVQTARVSDWGVGWRDERLPPERC